VQVGDQVWRDGFEKAVSTRIARWVDLDQLSSANSRCNACSASDCASRRSELTRFGECKSRGNAQQTAAALIFGITHTLKTALTFAAVLAVAIGVLLYLKKQGLFEGKGTRPWPFYVKKPLTQPEQILYHRLSKALPEHIVLAQVQVSRVLGVKKGSNFNEWNNRINRMSYDFVVCAKDSTVLAVIELDDKSHESKSRAATDEKKNKATSDAGLRLIRWHVKALPDEAAIQSEVRGAASAPTAVASR
jgi:very-short-patch-repair endonuclease